ncbi:Probable serine/threonine-protein kinase drkA [Geodia barretti]|uniref:Probable serine/threonine-protein kinase drkA n=1 Tax=Geodia barretti TaxID=519541 RepID=A0AA35T787_GEOBA|nr:Probable serine/threonine-protein kinase drkA [Geodia barretti]
MSVHDDSLLKRQYAIGSSAPWLTHKQPTELEMATTQQPTTEDIRQVLETAPQLDQFLLHNVTQTGRQLGGGSYGVVEELEMDGLTCAGKKIYDVLVDPENLGAQRVVERYYKECSLLSDIRHPHVVQFLGICFFPDSQLPALVMERLHVSLDELLETMPDIPLFTKLSILEDVARGLVFLHNRSPVIIHRDLTARNVLLTAGMTAKIADLGNSRIASLRPDQVAQTMTMGIPGTLVYMPPEASTQHYGPPLDLFSFGHLSLFAATQVFPGDLKPPTYFDAIARKVTGRTELDRREVYVSTLKEMLGGSHAMVLFIKGCLAYEPEKRPTARQALECLAVMKTRQTDPYQHMNRLQIERICSEKVVEIEKRDKEIVDAIERLTLFEEQLQQSEEQRADLEKACEEKDKSLMIQEDVQSLKIELKKCQMEKAELEEVAKGKEKMLAVKELETMDIPRLRKELKECQLEKSGIERLYQLKEEMAIVKEQEIAVKHKVLLDAQKQLATQTEEYLSLKEELKRKSAQIHSLKDDHRALETLKAEEIEMWESKFAAKDRQLLKEEEVVSETMRELSALQQKCSSLETQLAAEGANADMMTVKEATIAALTAELKEKDKFLQLSKNKVLEPLPSLLTCNLPLKWSNPMNMPLGMWAGQAVLLGGNIYVGGGGAEKNRGLLKFKMEGNVWTLISWPVENFGLAVVSDQLVAIGGAYKNSGAIDEVWVFNPATAAWLQPFPRMPTARSWASAIGFKRWVIVAGGSGKKCVEVLDTVTKEWYNAIALPRETARPSLTIDAGNPICGDGEIHDQHISSSAHS